MFLGPAIALSESMVLQIFDLRRERSSAAVQHLSTSELTAYSMQERREPSRNKT